MSKPWRKLFAEKMRSSTRIRRLSVFEWGVYMKLWCAADDVGALVNGRHPWTIDDVAAECGTKRTARIAKAVSRLESDDLLTRDIRGAWIVSNFSSLQRQVPPAAKPAKPRPATVQDGPASIADVLVGSRARGRSDRAGPRETGRPSVSSASS